MGVHFYPLRPTTITIALVYGQSHYSLASSHNQPQVVAVFALRVEFTSISERSTKTRRVVANSWSAMHRDQSDCNGVCPVVRM